MRKSPRNIERLLVRRIQFYRKVATVSSRTRTQIDNYIGNSPVADIY